MLGVRGSRSGLLRSIKIAGVGAGVSTGVGVDTECDGNGNASVEAEQPRVMKVSWVFVFSMTSQLSRRTDDVVKHKAAWQGARVEPGR
jgi:hypothetical protein